jgi:4-amino-4-deoxy-L-arabinose transferase-like glycosyltransferase
MRGSKFSIGLSTGKKLFFIVCLGFFVRLYVVLNAVTVSPDSTRYLHFAGKFAQGDYRGGLDTVIPLFYPLTVALASVIFQDLELSGRVVSLVFGTLAIPVSFYLGRLIYNERVGLFAAFFAAVHPYMVRYSADALAEGLYYFLAPVAVLIGLKAVRGMGVGWMSLAGLFSALAYLTRPEGVGLMVIISLWALFYNLRLLKDDWGKRLGMVASGWAVFILIAIPYLLYIYQDTGGFAISGKLSFGSTLSSIKGLPFNGQKLVAFLKNLPGAFSVPFFVLFFYGLFKRRRDGFTPAEYYLMTILVSFWFLYLCVLPQRRYFVELMPMALVFAATGFYYVEHWLKGRVKEKAHLAAALLLLLITAVQLPKGMVSLHANRLPERLAGEWLEGHEDGPFTIMARKPIVAFYAGGNYLRLPGGRLEDVIKYGKEKGAVYMAGYGSGLGERIPDFDTEKGRFLEEVSSFKGIKGDEFIIYGFGVEE